MGLRDPRPPSLHGPMSSAEAASFWRYREPNTLHPPVTYTSRVANVKRHHRRWDGRSVPTFLRLPSSSFPPWSGRRLGRSGTSARISSVIDLWPPLPCGFPNHPRRPCAQELFGTQRDSLRRRGRTQSHPEALPRHGRSAKLSVPRCRGIAPPSVRYSRIPRFGGIRFASHRGNDTLSDRIRP